MTVLNTSFRDRLTVTDVVRLARMIYSDAYGGIKYKQMLRPYICPFHILIELIPPEANILDVGCGAGLFILALARLGRIQSAVGFDDCHPSRPRRCRKATKVRANSVRTGFPFGSSREPVRSGVETTCRSRWLVLHLSASRP